MKKVISTGILFGGSLSYLSYSNYLQNRQYVSCENKKSSLLRAEQSFSPNHSYIQPPTNFQLECVIMLLRHGDRTPIATEIGETINSREYENFWKRILAPVRDQLLCDALNPVYCIGNEPKEDKYQSPLAQLTATGAHECFSVGKAIRERYTKIGFLPIHLQVNLISVYATNFSRTQHSAQRFLLGLYPEEFRTRLNAQIPVVVRPLSQEVLIANADGKCHALTTLIANSANHSTYPGYKELEDETKAIFKIKNHVKWSEVREVLTCHLLHGVALPVGADTELLSKISDYNTWLWSSWYENKPSQKLAVGRLFSEISTIISKAVTKQSDIRFVLFTAHDNSLFPFKAALEIPSDKWPKYCSNVIIEVAKDKNSQNRFIRVLSDDQEFIICKNKNNSVWCPWDTFFSHINEISVSDDDYQNLCSNYLNKKDNLIQEKERIISEEMNATIKTDNNR
eukprot:c19657_g1_i3.p1 GENE.c19657_g1_i3~~c19657_g1_i3.p1  ORF type:complete len:454 (-),score=156.94 c19657_g1_i3:326-1687(-)